MRARLLLTVSLLVLVAVTGLGGPLAAALASGATGGTFTDRLSDTTRFAALGQRAVADGDTDSLRAELVRYDRVYDIAAAVVDRQGLVLAASRPMTAPPNDTRVRAALLGQRSTPVSTVYPWSRDPMVLAEPVLVDGEVRGAAVTVSPVVPVTREIAAAWMLLLVAALGALVLGVAVCLPLVRWILAPVHQLERGTAEVVAAVGAGLRPDPVGDGRGPPELRRLRRRFDQMATSVAQALEAQRTFVADAGHQLRNPLTALRLRMQTVDEEIGDLPADVSSREFLRGEQAAALDEIDRFVGLLDELLALARAEGRPSELTGVELDAVVGERTEAWSVLAAGRGLRLVRCGETGLIVQSDPGSMVAVLDALLDNALKYAPVDTAVEVGTSRTPQGVDVVVRDHGRGLSPDELGRATDRFWRSPSQRGVDGSGLGLAIASRAATQAGGTLVLDTPGDGGLRAILRLPAGRDAGGPPALRAP